MTKTVHSFHAEADAHSVVLVLGTMPGRESLKAGRYYVHPKNVFWRLVSDIFGVDPAAEYTRRLDALKSRGVALWDVLQRCTRESSLDSEIADPIPNDFVTFFKEHPQVTKVFFNGNAAERHYTKHVSRTLPPSLKLSYQCLPSTSAALAIKYAEKLARWSVIKTEH
jgi:hypoxanthine-DNA glycosylase